MQVPGGGGGGGEGGSEVSFPLQTYDLSGDDTIKRDDEWENSNFFHETISAPRRQENKQEINTKKYCKCVGVVWVKKQG